MNKKIKIGGLISGTGTNMDAIIKACEANGVQLGTIMPSRFSPANLELKKAIEKGADGLIATERRQVEAEEPLRPGAARDGAVGVEGGGRPTGDRRGCSRALWCEGLLRFARCKIEVLARMQQKNGNTMQQSAVCLTFAK